MSDHSEGQVFFDESGELLAQMESGLLACEKSAPTADGINAIFRAAHTIKGSAGMFGFDFIVTFVHEVETVLDRVRLGNVVLNPPLVVALLACGDHIGTMIERLKQGHDDLDAAATSRGADLVEEIRGLSGVGAAAVVSTAASAPVTHALVAAAGRPGEAYAGTDQWHVSVRFGADTFRNGMDPMSFLRYLATFGELTRVITRADGLQVAGQWDPETCYLGFDLRLRADVERARIVDAFDFVREDCLLEVIEPHSPLASYLQAMRRVDGDDAELARLVEVGSLTESELAAACTPAQTHAARAAESQQDAETNSAAPAGSAPTAPAPTKAAAEARSIRIDAAKLDTLITLVGELIICAAGTQLGARRSRDEELLESASQLGTLVEQVRDSVLQLRMVRIGATFSRFHRVVHDTARELGKNIRLSISGEDTELDKTLVEKIADPLTHLIRNAVDHGIGPAEERVADGKPAEGTVSLNAYHDSGHIVIEVSDDGRGLNRQRILAKAIERGLVPAGAQPSQHEIDSLIFEPGFSTAEKVTNVSGRGVGMDVVKRNIAALRGSVEVRSREGSGTTFVIRLPLTLAIINGFQVAVGKSVLVLPLEMVDECIEYSCEPGHDYANVRGRVLPFVRLHELLALRPREGARQNIVIVNSGGQRAGLVVDALLGECQTVIKPLSKILGRADCVSGSSILGNGEVALILDVPALVQRAISAASGTKSVFSNTAPTADTFH